MFRSGSVWHHNAYARTNDRRAALVLPWGLTATFRILYVFVVMEVGSCRRLRIAVTEHPAAEWSIQRFREFLAFDHF